MKIVQIMATKGLEDTIYGLGDDNIVYIWSTINKRMPRGPADVSAIEAAYPYHYFDTKSKLKWGWKPYEP